MVMCDIGGVVDGVYSVVFIVVGVIGVLLVVRKLR